MKPKYIEIADLLEMQIKDGTLKPKSMLSKESELQQEFSVSRVTIRKSLQILVDKKLINRTRGSGTYINEIKTQHDALQLFGFIEEVSKQGKNPSSKVIKFELKKPSLLIAERLNIETTADIFEVHRLRYIDNEPEIYEITHMPISLFPELSISIMNGSKYDYIEKTKGMKIVKSRQLVEPYILDNVLAAHLNQPISSAILKVESIGYLDTNIPFEFTINFFRLNQYSFEFIATRSS